MSEGREGRRTVTTISGLKRLTFFAQALNSFPWGAASLPEKIQVARWHWKVIQGERVSESEDSEARSVRTDQLVRGRGEDLLVGVQDLRSPSKGKRQRDAHDWRAEKGLHSPSHSARSYTNAHSLPHLHLPLCLHNNSSYSTDSSQPSSSASQSTPLLSAGPSSPPPPHPTSTTSSPSPQRHPHQARR